jgi:hypothetical protein
VARTRITTLKETEYLLAKVQSMERLEKVENLDCLFNMT